MEGVQLERRCWTIFKRRRFWLRITQMVCATFAIVLCCTFDQKTGVQDHEVKQNYYYHIFLSFPFMYKSNVTVQYSRSLPLREFKFEKLLFPSAITFVTVTGLAFVATTIKFCLLIREIFVHGSRGNQQRIKWIFFLSLGITFLLLLSVCLWMANLITLVQDVQKEIDFLFDQCNDQKLPTCDRKDPDFIPLYFSTVFGMLLFFLWTIECIQIFIEMVYTIPAQITRPLVRNVELYTVELNVGK